MEVKEEWEGGYIYLKTDRDINSWNIRQRCTQCNFMVFVGNARNPENAEKIVRETFLRGHRHKTQQPPE